MSIKRAQQEIDSAEFSEWIAYAHLEPFGEERADLRMGILASTFVNMMSAKGKRYQPKDFMPKFGPTEQMSVEQMKARFAMATGMKQWQ